MANRPCIECGKPSLKSRCPQHEIVRDRNLSTRHLDRAYIEAAGQCALCGNHVLRADATLDHIIPLSRGGTDHPTNLRLAHRSCNSSRGAA